MHLRRQKTTTITVREYLLSASCDAIIGRWWGVLGDRRKHSVMTENASRLLVQLPKQPTILNSPKEWRAYSKHFVLKWV